MANDPKWLSLSNSVSSGSQTSLAVADALVPLGGDLWIDRAYTIATSQTLVSSKIKDGGGSLTVSDGAVLTITGVADSTLRIICPSSFYLNCPCTTVSGSSVIWVENATSLPQGARVSSNATIPVGTTVLSQAPYSLSTTGDTTSASKSIVNVASTLGLYKGMPITGTNIPNHCVVADFVANTSITLSKAATGSTSGGTITVSSTLVTLSANATASSAWIPLNFTKGGVVAFTGATPSVSIEQFHLTTDTDYTNAFHTAFNCVSASGYLPLNIGPQTYNVTNDICPPVQANVYGATRGTSIISISSGVYGYSRCLPSTDTRMGKDQDFRITGTATEALYSIRGLNVTLGEARRLRIGTNASGRGLLCGGIGAGTARSFGPIVMLFEQVLVSGCGNADLPQWDLNGVTTTTLIACEGGTGATGASINMAIDDSANISIINGTWEHCGVGIVVEGRNLGNTRGVDNLTVDTTDFESPIIVGGASTDFMQFGLGWTGSAGSAVLNSVVRNCNFSKSSAGSSAYCVEAAHTTNLQFISCSFPEGTGSTGKIYLQGTDNSGFYAGPNPRNHGALFTAPYILWNDNAGTPISVGANSNRPWDQYGYTATIGRCDTATGTLTLTPGTAPTTSTNWAGAQVTVLTAALSGDLTVSLPTASLYPQSVRTLVAPSNLNAHALAYNSVSMIASQAVTFQSDGTAWERIQ